MTGKISAEVVIVGGGVIGLSIAYALAKKGLKIIVLERGKIGRESSYAAGGMLGAQVEMDKNGPLFQLGLESRRLYPDFVGRLESETGISVGYRPTGILRVATEPEERESLQKRLNWQRSEGLAGEWLEPVELKRIEPFLEPHYGALYLPDDTQVDSRQLCRVLAVACRRNGVAIYEDTEAAALVKTDDKVTGVSTNQGGQFDAQEVVVAGGAWTHFLLEPLGIRLPIYPVKGQAVAVRFNRFPLSKTIFTHGCYLIPKADGRLIVGATEEREAGYQNNPSIQVSISLLTRAIRLMPALAEAEWIESWSGLRPAAADLLPVMGRFGKWKGLSVASGHLRNGILLAPVTGALIAQLITEGKMDGDWAAFAPDRFLK